MGPYSVPQQELLFLLNDVLNYNQHVEQLGFEDVGADVVEMILPEAARFFEEQVAPTNTACDLEGAKFKGSSVSTPAVLSSIYQQMLEAGWTSLSGKTEYGGAGFPGVAGLLVQEIMQSSNLAFSLLPMLSSGVVHALDLYANDAQKEQYLTKLISGEWAGTMNLTEPQAGTDLGAIKTRAVQDGDHYKISGQKIYITWGDHEVTENIIQLVLARTPDAPAGTKGISMFIVPKYLVNEDGSLGARNDSKAVGLEHKLGIHSSPTCTMQFGENGGAIGYLVGEENQGLVYMFAMMNAARLGVGHQGVAVSERAYQQAVAFAQDRVQSAVPGMDKTATIINHPDVRRMLMQMRSLTDAGRALSFEAYACEDRAHNHPDETVRQQNAVMVGLLTPLVKAWCTESSIEVTSLGIQVHGGMGFIEETGAAQHYRDARILPIYEGTNGIQALDFIGRKTLRDGGQGVSLLLAACRATGEELSQNEQLGDILQALTQALNECDEALAWILAQPEEAETGAFNYMMLFANTACFWMLARSAQAAADLITQGKTERFYQQKLVTTRYFMRNILTRNSQYLQSLKSGSADIMALTNEDYERA